eukprot:366433-Chlamydomonas_euryale.AAC.12
MSRLDSNSDRARERGRESGESTSRRARRRPSARAGRAKRGGARDTEGALRLRVCCAAVAAASARGGGSVECRRGRSRDERNGEWRTAGAAGEYYLHASWHDMRVRVATLAHDAMGLAAVCSHATPGEGLRRLASSQPHGPQFGAVPCMGAPLHRRNNASIPTRANLRTSLWRPERCLRHAVAIALAALAGDRPGGQARHEGRGLFGPPRTAAQAAREGREVPNTREQ